jgi:hypothetical protein
VIITEDISSNGNGTEVLGDTLHGFADGMRRIYDIDVQILSVMLRTLLVDLLQDTHIVSVIGIEPEYRPGAFVWGMRLMSAFLTAFLTVCSK